MFSQAVNQHASSVRGGSARTRALLVAVLSCVSAGVGVYPVSTEAASLSQWLESAQRMLGGGKGEAAPAGQEAMARAIRESLELGSGRASDLLSQVGGYASHPVYRIELPASVQPVARGMRTLGLGPQVDRIEELMNRGAEQAASEAKAVFIDAVRAMTLTDALGIVRGPQTAATDFFRTQTEASLRSRYQPIIQRNLEQIGFYTQYKQLLNSYQALPLANKPNLDLEQHVVTRALDGLFAQVAEEERKIRQDPLGRGSRAIAAVFGQGR